MRVGRFYLPFGEEYQKRMVLDDPLISHSASDIWGLDQGVEAYGKRGDLSYVVAVQNGGNNQLRDFNADKSVTGRIGYDPAAWLHLSASAMRTGRLNSAGDQLSAMWFGIGFLRMLGPGTATSVFSATLGELDGSAHWNGGSLAAAGGLLNYGDSGRTANDSRRLTYYYIESTQQLTGQLLAAARFSHISAPRGFPLVGQNIQDLPLRQYPGQPHPAPERRPGLPLGPPLVLGSEYSPEWGGPWRAGSGTTRTSPSRPRTRVKF